MVVSTTGSLSLPSSSSFRSHRKKSKQQELFVCVLLLLAVIIDAADEMTTTPMWAMRKRGFSGKHSKLLLYWLKRTGYASWLKIWLSMILMGLDVLFWASFFNFCCTLHRERCVAGCWEGKDNDSSLKKWFEKKANILLANKKHILLIVGGGEQGKRWNISTYCECFNAGSDEKSDAHKS